MSFSMSIVDRDQSLSPVLCFGLPAKRKKQNYENLKISMAGFINQVFCLNQSKDMTDKHSIFLVVLQEVGFSCEFLLKS